MKNLPNTIARLCNRLAAEQMKAQTWQLGEELRAEYGKRLVEGEGLADLESDLHKRVSQAALEQFRVSLMSTRKLKVPGTNPNQHPGFARSLRT